MKLLFLLFLLLICFTQVGSGRRGNLKFHQCEEMGGMCKYQKTHGCSILPAQCKSRYKHCCRV
ncbi:beta-defensin 33-like [Peromyscus maniculatus bairdii]|uniref:Defensin beta 33 n=1 Tax=Peromyscus maniculatus bairdii TaxID=230844 RepID=A0A6J0CXP4_PERMB|nr:beta-defensin 33-like [Peromyscus maniculatus bairdii]XP_037067515.1 beta-defensin 33-like [Peromyscus leucopus]XP_037067516.1 beta-defensin 33-like [Peromyscus leucopus]